MRAPLLDGYYLRQLPDEASRHSCHGEIRPYGENLPNVGLTGYGGGSQTYQKRTRVPATGMPWWSTAQRQLARPRRDQAR